MVTIKYNDRVLIPSIEPGESKTIHSHNFKMPGNFTVEAAHGWIEPGEEGKYQGQYNVTEAEEETIITKIKYEDKLIEEIDFNKTANLQCSDKLMKSNIIITTPRVEALKSATPKKTEKVEVTPSAGYAALSKVIINEIPSKYIEPTEKVTITENRIYNESDNVPMWKEAIVNVQPTSSELILTPAPWEIEKVPSESGVEYFNKVTVHRIPEDYIVPQGTIDLSESGEHDVREYAKANVIGLAELKGVSREYKTLEPVTAGTFVEFLIKYGSGNLVESASDIKVYQINNERFLILYINSSGVEKILGVQNFSGNIFISENPLTIPVEEGGSVYKSQIAILNDETCVYFQAYEIQEGDILKNKVRAQPFAIRAEANGDITLAWLGENPRTLYTSDTAIGPDIVTLKNNYVFISLYDSSQTTLYSTLQTVNDAGIWTTINSAAAGFEYSNSNVLTKIDENRVLAIWVESNTLKTGIIYSIDEDGFNTGVKFSLSDITSFVITEPHEDKGVIITKNSSGIQQFRIITIGTDTVSIGEPIEICQQFENALINVIKISNTKTLVLYTEIEQGQLFAKLITQGGDSVLVSTIDIGKIVISNLEDQEQSFEQTVISPKTMYAIPTDSMSILFFYTDEKDISKYISMNLDIDNNRLLIDESEKGSYVFPTTSNTAIIGVATSAAEAGKTVKVIRPS